MMWVRTLFILGMVAIPAGGIAGLSAFGEVAREMSVYFFLPAMVLALLQALPSPLRGAGRSFAADDASILNKAVLLIGGAIMLSALANGYGIFQSQFRGREGIEKLLSSLTVLFYGFGLSYLTYFITAGSDWRKLIVTPIAVSIWICAGYSLFEVASRSFGILNGVYHFFDNIFHSGFNSYGWIMGWDTRIRSLAFEPPALGNTLGFAWPWVYYGYVTLRGTARLRYFILFVLLNILLLLSGARTAFVMLGGILTVLFFLRFAFLPPHPKKEYRQIGMVGGILAGCFVAAITLTYIFTYGHLRDTVIAGEDISNISRLSSIEAAFTMFKDYPLFGVGFGQFGFYIVNYMPYWGFYSYELLPKLVSPEEPWPAVYMIYARLACETGLLGLLMWPVLWLSFAQRMIKQTFVYFRMTGVMLPEAYPLVISGLCVLLSGLTTDTLRTPMIWVTLGLTCRYLQDMKVNVQNYILAESSKAMS